MATVTNYDLFEDLFHFIKNPNVEISDVIKEHGGEVVGVGLLVDRSGGKVDFAVKTKALLTLSIETYPAATCPMCAQGQEFTKRGRTGK